MRQLECNLCSRFMRWIVDYCYWAVWVPIWSRQVTFCGLLSELGWHVILEFLQPWCIANNYWYFLWSPLLHCIIPDFGNTTLFICINKGCVIPSARNQSVAHWNREVTCFRCNRPQLGYLNRLLTTRKYVPCASVKSYHKLAANENVSFVCFLGGGDFVYHWALRNLRKTNS